jgi:hypothetical protein
MYELNLKHQRKTTFFENNPDFLNNENFLQKFSYGNEISQLNTIRELFEEKLRKKLNKKNNLFKEFLEKNKNNKLSLEKFEKENKEFLCKYESLKKEKHKFLGYMNSLLEEANENNKRSILKGVLKPAKYITNTFDHFLQQTNSIKNIREYSVNSVENLINLIEFTLSTFKNTLSSFESFIKKQDYEEIYFFDIQDKSLNDLKYTLSPITFINLHETLKFMDNFLIFFSITKKNFPNIFEMFEENKIIDIFFEKIKKENRLTKIHDFLFLYHELNHKNKKVIFREKINPIIDYYKNNLINIDSFPSFDEFKKKSEEKSNEYFNEIVEKIFPKKNFKVFKKEKKDIKKNNSIKIDTIEENNVEKNNIEEKKSSKNIKSFTIDQEHYLNEGELERYHHNNFKKNNVTNSYINKNENFSKDTDLMDNLCDLKKKFFQQKRFHVQGKENLKVLKNILTNNDDNYTYSKVLSALGAIENITFRKGATIGEVFKIVYKMEIKDDKNNNDLIKNIKKNGIKKDYIKSSVNTYKPFNSKDDMVIVNAIVRLSKKIGLTSDNLTLITSKK